MSFDWMRARDILAIYADQIARYCGGKGEGEGIKNPGL